MFPSAPIFQQYNYFRQNLEEKSLSLSIFISFASNFLCKILWDNKNIDANIFIFSNSIFTMKGVRYKKSYFEFFLKHGVIYLCAKFEVYTTPPSGFLPIDTPFLANMWWEYFSFNIWTVVYQSELEFSDFDQKWAKTRPLLFKNLELPISIA